MALWQLSALGMTSLAWDVGVKFIHQLFAISGKAKIKKGTGKYNNLRHLSIR